MSISIYKCITLYCKKEPAIKLRNDWYCDTCWLKHCEVRL